MSFVPKQTSNFYKPCSEFFKHSSLENSPSSLSFTSQTIKEISSSSKFSCDKSISTSNDKEENYTHNLDIQQYNLKELLGLFNINTYDFSLNDLKKAKKMVLMMHPDKSKLPHDYFIFYKKAFEIVVKFYSNKNKTEEEVSQTNKNTQYSHVSSNAIENTYDKNTIKTLINYLIK
jgi:cation transport regulator ChaB